MNLPARDFESTAKALPEGRRVRVEHDCGEGRTLLVECKPGGWSAWCFRCGKKGWLPKELTLEQRLKQLAGASDEDALAQESLELPGPGVMDPRRWPDEPRVWLYRNGFSDTDIMGHGWFWHAGMRRLVLPAKDASGELVYWQARGFDARPKALNPTIDRSDLRIQYGSGSYWCALTEDMLSAAKVGSVGGGIAMPLLGTVLSTDTALFVAGLGRPVLLLLDDDPAGRRGAARADRLLRLLGVTPRQIYFGRDPKAVPRDELRAAIQGALT